MSSEKKEFEASLKALGQKMYDQYWNAELFYAVGDASTEEQIGPIIPYVHNRKMKMWVERDILDRAGTWQEYEVKIKVTGGFAAALTG